MPEALATLLPARARTVAAALLAGLVGVLLAVGPGAPVAAAHGPVGAPSTVAVKGDDDPLAVEIDAVSPDVAVATEGATVTIGGTVTNLTDEPWTSVRVYPLTSGQPLTTEAELAEAAAEEADSYVGNRITDDGVFDASITTLLPDETQRFSVTVPLSALQVRGGAGTYWLGVHALGENSEGRTANAAGKARTFLPILPEGTRTTPVPTSVVVPIREQVVSTADGAVADPSKWAELFGPEGRLREIVDLAGEPGAGSVSWLLDPALLDVAYRLAVGNPGRDLGPTEDPAGEDGGEGEDEGAEEPLAPATPATPETGDEPTEADEELAALAQDWLDDAVAALEDADVLALPYGDVDLQGVLQRDPRLYGAARALSRDALARYGLSGRDVVAPPAEGITTGALALLEPDETVLVDDDHLPGGALPDDAVAGSVGDATVVATDASAAAGGPLPGLRTTPLQVRQRIVSETVVQDLDGSAPSARVVLLPATWDPSGEGLPLAGASSGLVDAVPLSVLEPVTPAPLTAADVTTDTIADDVVPPELVDAARRLVVDGQRLDRVLPDNSTLSVQVAREAAFAVSYADRVDPDAALSSVRGASEDIDGLLDRITVEVPASVTLASETGKFNARVVNGLDQAIEVRVGAGGGRGVRVEPSDPVTVPAGGSTTVLLDASLTLLGVYDLTVVVTDVDGTSLGSTATTRVRSTAVSDVIWIVIGVAFVVLAAATSLWIRRRRAAADALEDASRTTGAPDAVAPPSVERAGP